MATANPGGVHSYEFDNFRLIPEERLLLRDNQPLALPPKVFDTLVVLVENGGHLVTKDDLLLRVWPNVIVEEATLARTISSLRKAFGPGHKTFIETVSKRGYRFNAPIRRVTKDESLSTVSEREAATPAAADGNIGASTKFNFSRLGPLSPSSFRNSFLVHLRAGGGVYSHK